MEKKLFLLVLILLVLPTIMSLELKVEKQSSDEVLIAELRGPATFDLRITNLDGADNIRFYNLLGFDMFPVGTVPISAGETKDVQLKISPIGELKTRGFYTLPYFIKGNDGSEVNQEITFNIIELKDTFEIGAGEFDPESSSVDIYIYNKVNFNFEKVKSKFSSAFFDLEETFSLEPYEKKTFTVQLNKEDFKKLVAGFYTLTAEVSVESQKINAEGVMNFKEKSIIKTTERDYGFLINTKIIEKRNEGNVVTPSETIIKKNIISRLFTSFSPEPDIVERKGLTTYYTWSRQLEPGDTLEIVVKTNWLFPLIIVLFLVAIVLLAKQYTKTDLVLKKRVSFVKAKGGEFALKVSVFVQAKKFVERVNIIDRLPPLVKLYERFGGEKPTRFNEKIGKLEWNFDKLTPGESRAISYIIYSKIGVMGKFALPATTAIYEREGEIKETESNRAFFVAEQRRKDVE